MKKKDKSTKTEKDKYQDGHENQNIRDFNPSQFAEEDDIDKEKKHKDKYVKKDENEIDKESKK